MIIHYCDICNRVIKSWDERKEINLWIEVYKGYKDKYGEKDKRIGYKRISCCKRCANKMMNKLLKIWKQFEKTEE